MGFPLYAQDSKIVQWECQEQAKKFHQETYTRRNKYTCATKEMEIYV